ncbi:MAG: hypothetical protein WC178_03080 [Candidatus Paceibacterota bacterium]
MEEAEKNKIDKIIVKYVKKIEEYMREYHVYEYLVSHVGDSVAAGRSWAKARRDQQTKFNDDLAGFEKEVLQSGAAKKDLPVYKERLVTSLNDSLSDIDKEINKYSIEDQKKIISVAIEEGVAMLKAEAEAASKK